MTTAWDEGTAANTVDAVLRVFQGEDLSSDTSTLGNIKAATGSQIPAGAHGSNTDPNALNAFLSATRQHESGGDYTIYNQSGLSDASGAYQFISSTWKGAGGSTRTAAEASPEEQDRIAAGMAQRLFEQFGDWRLVAIAWYGGPGIAERVARGENVGSPDQQGPYEAYGDTIVNMMRGGQ